MNISIFGLGYVGCVSLGCLAKKGHRVIGIDVNQEKIDLINKGLPTIIEKDIDQLIKEAHIHNMISATKDYEYAVINTEVSIICVGTPSTEEGHLDLKYIFETASQIGKSLISKNTFHIVAIRSTVLPGTNEKVGKIIEETSGKDRNKDFAIISNPEFLREGTAVNDYFNPPYIVVGCDNEKALNSYLEIYKDIDSQIERTDIKVAELLKYVNNSYHALKVVFANEIGSICKNLKIDSHEVMRIFCNDNLLNISPSYFKPGFSYGGSCLPKDLKALKTMAHDLYLKTPVIDHINESNVNIINLASNRIQKFGKKRILFLGISFKAGTDDLRHSPSVILIESLIGKGFNVHVFDKNITVSKLIGKNKSYIIEKLPHINNLLISDLNEAIIWSDVIIITNYNKDYENLNIPNDKLILDFVRIKYLEKLPNYEGLLW